MRVSERECMQFVTDALEPGRRAEIAEAAKVQPSLAARLESAERALKATPNRPSWSLPPPANTPEIRVQTQLAAVMGNAHIELAIDVEPHGDRALVVLGRGERGWQRLWPARTLLSNRDVMTPGEPLRLRLDTHGATELALLDVPLSLRTAADLDAAIQELVSAGEVRVSRVHLRPR